MRSEIEVFSVCNRDTMMLEHASKGGWAVDSDNSKLYSSDIGRHRKHAAEYRVKVSDN